MHFLLYVENCKDIELKWLTKESLVKKLLTILFPLGISLYVSFCITILCGRFCCSFLTKKHAEVDNRYILE